MSQKFREVQQVLVYVLILNLAVAFAKIAYGKLTGTLSMIADGYHSLFDGTSNIIGLVGIYIAARPPDKEHPYGHEKYETLASLFIALLLLFVGIEIFQSAFKRLLIPIMPEVTAISFLFELGTMSISYLVTRYEYIQGESLRSQVLIADSVHTKTDIYVSFSVIVSLIAIKLGFPIIDPIVSLVISLIIFRAGYRVIKESSRSFLDVSRIEENKICQLAMEVEGVMGCHKVRTRGSMGDTKVDLHVLVQPDMSVRDAHLISQRVSKKLTEEYKDVSDVIVHLDPYSQQPQESNRKKTS